MKEGDGRKERVEGEGEEKVRKERGKRKFVVDCSDGNDIRITWHLMDPHARV